MRFYASLAIVCGLVVGCASATVEGEQMRLTARGKSSATVCTGEGREKVCTTVKGGAISQVFGDVLLAPFRIVAGMLTGAAGAVAPSQPEQ